MGLELPYGKKKISVDIPIKTALKPESELANKDASILSLSNKITTLVEQG
jgi:hypothetical protein